MILPLLLVLLDKELHPLDMVTRADIWWSLIHFRGLEVDRNLPHHSCRCFILGLDLGCLGVLRLLDEVEDVVLLEAATALSGVVTLAHLWRPHALNRSTD